MPATSKQIRQINKVYNKLESACDYSAGFHLYLESIKKLDSGNKNEENFLPRKMRIRLLAIKYIFEFLSGRYSNPDLNKELFYFSLWEVYAVSLSRKYKQRIFDELASDIGEARLKSVFVEAYFISFLEDYDFKTLNSNFGNIN